METAKYYPEDKVSPEFEPTIVHYGRWTGRSAISWSALASVGVATAGPSVFGVVSASSIRARTLSRLAPSSPRSRQCGLKVTRVEPQRLEQIEELIASPPLPGFVLRDCGPCRSASQDVANFLVFIDPGQRPEGAELRPDARPPPVRTPLSARSAGRARRSR